MQDLVIEFGKVCVRNKVTALKRKVQNTLKVNAAKRKVKKSSRTSSLGAEIFLQGGMEQMAKVHY